MRFVVFSLLLLLPASLPSAAPSTGTVSGKVIVTRNGKEEKRDFVFVYLERKRGGPRVPKPAPIRTAIAQKNQVFNPRVRVIPLRSTVDFPNQEKDPKLEHNVFSPTDPVFDLKRFPPGKSADRSFEFEGEYDIYCDIHSNMTAKVKVVDSQYIAEVKNGAFALTDVPPGEYKLHVWTPNTNEVIESVTIVAGQTTAVPHILKIPLKAVRPTGHLRKDGTAYPACTYNGAQSCKPTDDVW